MIKKSCFVIMPFSQKYDGIYSTIIKPTVQNEGFNCFRADDIFSPSSILDDIFHSINEAFFLIADISEPNPNVYYELGYTHAKNNSNSIVSGCFKNSFRLQTSEIYCLHRYCYGSGSVKKSIGKSHKKYHMSNPSGTWEEDDDFDEVKRPNIVRKSLTPVLLCCKPAILWMPPARDGHFEEHPNGSVPFQQSPGRGPRPGACVDG